jgi:hypothetical protein
MADEGDANFLMWRDEINRAIKRDTKWCERGRKINKRYRDQRTDASEGSVTHGRRKFNILWSNVQTLMPSLYAKRPDPVVERRFLDHDPVGRVASTILERTLKYELEENGFHEAMKAAVLDYLLPGRGQVWVRFEPGKGAEDSEEESFSPEQEGGSPYDDESATADGGGIPKDGQMDTASYGGAGTPPMGLVSPLMGDNGGPPLDEAFECCPVDYVHWEDFLTSQARIWSEVTWVARRVWMGRSELVKRWPDVGKEIPLERPRDATGRFQRGNEGEELRKAEIFEIWCKETGKVHFIAKNWDRMVEEVPDPLHLKDFWPCPRPLAATQTHDTTEPVADYDEYRDQAEQLDDLTNRLGSLIKALKVAGAYDSSATALKRLLDEGSENKLVPVDNWAAFAEKGGLEGAIVWLPIKDIAAVIVQLFEARNQIKQDLYEITGIADIIRGQSDPRETLGAQKLKGGFATQRLSARQVEVARFARDVIAIVAEIIAEHWSPQTLVMASSILQDDGLAAMPAEPAAPNAPTGPPPNAGPGGPPASVPAPQGGPPPMMAAPPPPDPQTVKLQMIGQAIALLRSQKLRGFRVDIETDSTIAADANDDKQQWTEFATAMGQMLQQLVVGAEQFPPVMGLGAQMLMQVMRRFRVGRDMEAAVDEFIDASKAFAADKAANPTPNPDQIKAQMMQQQQMAETQRQQVQFAQDQQLQQMEVDKAILEFKMKSAQAARDDQLAEAAHQREMAKMTMDMFATQEATDAKIAVARATKNEATQ